MATHLKISRGKSLFAILALPFLVYHSSVSSYVFGESCPTSGVKSLNTFVSKFFLFRGNFLTYDFNFDILILSIVLRLSCTSFQILWYDRFMTSIPFLVINVCIWKPASGKSCTRSFLYVRWSGFVPNAIVLNFAYGAINRAKPKIEYFNRSVLIFASEKNSKVATFDK